MLRWYVAVVCWLVSVLLIDSYNARGAQAPFAWYENPKMTGVNWLAHALATQRMACTRVQLFCVACCCLLCLLCVFMCVH